MMLANVRSFLVALFQFGKRRGEKAVTGRPGKRKARTELPLSKRRREEREKEEKEEEKRKARGSRTTQTFGIETWPFPLLQFAYLSSR